MILDYFLVGEGELVDTLLILDLYFSDLSCSFVMWLNFCRPLSLPFDYINFSSFSSI